MLLSSYILSFSTAAASFFIKAKFTVFVNLFLFIFFIPLLLLLPRILFVHTRIQKRVTRKWVSYFDRINFAFLGIEVPAVLFLHDNGAMQYDRFIHFVTSGLVFLAVLLGVCAIYSCAHIEKRRFLFLFGIFLLVLVLLFVWEGYQYGMDALFGIQVFFGDGIQDNRVDFWEDILFGLAGAALTLFFIDGYFRRFLRLAAEITHRV